MTWRRFVPGATAVEVVLAVVACGGTALVYRGFFATPGYLPALGVACFVGGVTAVLGHRRTWSTALAAAAGPVLVLVAGVFGGRFSDVLPGVRGSWNRLLTVAAPADPWPELLVLPALVLWAAAFCAVLLVLRARAVLAPLAPLLTGFLAALFTVGNQAGGHALATVVFLVPALGLIAVRAHRRTGGGTIRIDQRSSRPIVALVVVGLLVAGSTLFGVVGGQALPLASGEHRFDPRDVLAPPIASTDTLTPLSQLKSQLKENPPRTLFTVRPVAGAGSNPFFNRVRTAVLDEFDGTTWTSSGTYRVAGSHLTADPALTKGQRVTAQIGLKDLDGPYLPVIGWPSRLVADGGVQGRFGFDPGSGVVVRTSPELRDLGYEVTGEVTAARSATQDQATSTTPGPVPELPRGIPDSLRELSARCSGSTDLDRLTSLEAHLRNTPSLLGNPPGQSYAAIARMLTSPAGGFTDQHVSAFTVLARAWGMPARVAVGYHLNRTQNGAYEVTTADADAWSEVHFAGHGWVPFDPSTGHQNSPATRPAEVPRVAPPSAAPPTSEQAAAPPSSSLPSATAQGQGLGRLNVLPGVLVLAPVVVLVVLLVGGYVVLAKARRRHRRRHGPDPAATVLGAWYDQLDRLAELGISPPVSLTCREVAAHARGRLGDAANAIEATAVLATTATYAPEHVGEDEAAEAWLLADRLRTELHPRRLSAARLRAALDPRPLWTVWSAARRRRQAREGLEVGRYR